MTIRGTQVDFWELGRRTALALFNGFTPGDIGAVVELYAGERADFSTAQRAPKLTFAASQKIDEVGSSLPFTAFANKIFVEA